MNSENQGTLALIRLIYRRKFLIAGTTVITGAVAGLFSYTMSPSFTAVATMYPAKQSQPAGLSSLLSLGDKFGMSGYAPVANPADILVDLAETNAFLSIIGEKKFRSEGLGREALLMDILRIEDKKEELRKYYLLKALKRSIRFNMDKRSGILTVKVTAPEKRLSKDVADTVIREINAFYRRLVGSKKSAYRAFLEKRLTEAELALRESEVRTKDFRERNLLSTNAPEILLAQTRFLRDARVNEEIFLTLKKEYEVARLEEQKDMPALDVLDAPEEPVFKTSPIRRKIAMFYSFLGFLAGCALAFGLEGRRKLAEILKSVTGKPE